jgi:ATP-dependent Clp protease ATP-binding subunit ClpA
MSNAKKKMEALFNQIGDWPDKESVMRRALQLAQENSDQENVNSYYIGLALAETKDGHQALLKYINENDLNSITNAMYNRFTSHWEKDERVAMCVCDIANVIRYIESYKEKGVEDKPQAKILVDAIMSTPGLFTTLLRNAIILNRPSIIEVSAANIGELGRNLVEKALGLGANREWDAPDETEDTEEAREERKRNLQRQREKAIEHISDLFSDLVISRRYMYEKDVEFCESVATNNGKYLSLLDEVLNRRGQNNVLLSGPIGVGKLSIVDTLVAELAISDDAEDRIGGTLLSFHFDKAYKTRSEQGVRTAFDLFLEFASNTNGIVVIPYAERYPWVVPAISPYIATKSLRVVMTTESAKRLLRNTDVRYFQKDIEVIEVEEPNRRDILKILKEHVNYLYTGCLSDKQLKMLAEVAGQFKGEAASPMFEVQCLEALVCAADDNGYLDNITDEHILTVVADKTGQKVKDLLYAKEIDIAKLEKTMTERVLGQEEAVKTLVASVRRTKAGIRDKKRPAGVFLFAGATGTGKTELCKQLGLALFGSEDIIRFDMSEFKERHTVSTLIGAPPGYVGYDESGTLLTRVQERPNSVVLFDEIEKAHPDIFDLLLQVLEYGILTGRTGKKVSFRNTIIVMTSNIGYQAGAQKKISGFGVSQNDHQAQVSKLNEQLKSLMRPEFINRIDSIVQFNNLGPEQALDITKIFLKELSERVLDTRDMRIDFTPELMEHISKNKFEAEFGARSLKREITNVLEDYVAELLMQPKYEGRKRLTIGVKDGKYTAEKAGK